MNFLSVCKLGLTVNIILCCSIFSSVISTNYDLLFPEFFTSETSSTKVCSDCEEEVVFTFGKPDLDVVIVPGSDFCIPVSVTNFEDVASFYFSFAFDPEVIQPHSTNPIINHPGLLIGDVTVINSLASNGILVGLYINLNANGLDLVDGAIPFELCFEIVGEVNDSIIFSMTPEDTPNVLPNAASIQCSDLTLPSNECPLILNLCPIPIEIASNTKDISDEVSIVISPNPASQTLSYELPVQKRDKITHVLVYNINGKLILEMDDNDYNKSKNRIDISDIEHGRYYLKVMLDHQEFVTKAFIKI